ncbi:hypothetical protein HPP92_020011 [Vanilla planifolia]|uniref:Uncharacterized protein n=1 Tax=Vanilla planifolia TaxID=51239 RepID=A0A835ULA8_VANPL|nr:hypothetical protein HPP92_020011 [Vanilla planifolia]
MECSNQLFDNLGSLKQVDGPDPNYKDVCFGGAGRDPSKSFPEVDMVFSSEKLKLTPENYLFRLTGIIVQEYTSQFQVGIITFDMFLNVTYLAIVTLLQELEELIARDLYISSDQVHLAKLMSKGNGSLLKWNIFPAGNSDFIANGAAIVIIARLTEHQFQLPNTFGSYEIVRWNVEPPSRSLLARRPCGRNTCGQWAWVVRWCSYLASQPY